MWCRTILTAVAISYVICMLLWSGLQKEDLDASTLEKLGRYNVNIGDMNNELQRQECLLEHVTTEVQNEALRTSATNERIQNDVNVAIYPKIGMLLAANFEDKTVLQNDVNINKTQVYLSHFPVISHKMPNSENVTKTEGNKGIIKIEYNIQNQPNVESVMNFWTKLTHFTTKIVTPLPTTSAPFTTTAQVETHNVKNGTNIGQAGSHSKDVVIEWISRIMSEYMATQTVTQRIPTRIFSNYVPVKYWEILNKSSVEEKPNRLNEQAKEINKINNETQDNLRVDKAIDNSMLDENKSMPLKVTYDSTRLNKRIQETPNSQNQINEPNVGESKPALRDNQKEILHKLLQMKSDLFNNGVLVPENISSTYNTKLFKNKSNDQHEVSDSFNIFNIFQNMNNSNNYIINNNETTSATLEAQTWEQASQSDEKIKTIPKVKKETNQEQKFVIYDVFKVAPTDIIKAYSSDTTVTNIPEKKSILHQNSDIDHKESRFQAMLPSIKYSKLNKNSESHNNQVKEMPTELNKKAVISQQPVAKETLPRNQLFKMKNDTFHANKGIISNLKQYFKVITDKKFKKAPVFHKLDPSYDSKKIKAIQDIINNYDQDNEQLTSINVTGLKSTPNADPVDIPEVEAIPANIIKEIADKVKRLVLKDIENVTNTTVGINSSPSSTSAASTTIFSTSMMTTITTTEISSTSLQKEFTQANHVMQKLMEIFKELKEMKDTAGLNSQMPPNTTTVTNSTTTLPQVPIQYPPAVPSYNPYLMQNPAVFKSNQAGHNPRMIQIPISSGVKEQNKYTQYMLPLNTQPTKNFGAITIQTNSDEIPPLPIQIPKPLKLINQHIVVSTKRTVDKKEVRQRISMKHVEDTFRIPTDDRNRREKLKHQSALFPDNLAKHEFRDRYFYKSRYMDRDKPWYNHEYKEKVQSIENTHPVRSRFPELHYPGRLSHLGHVDRPRDLSNSEDSSHTRGHNRPGFNNPGNHRNGIRHHPGSNGHSDYDRQPRYEATKFHEKLERIENWPRSTWKDFHSPSDSSNDEISARQQMPLMKVKQRTRYDDSHFANFLKSQQKVTDMLEKILANNIKNSRPKSVETL